MGAAGLIEIKRRVKSIESTRKITKAMGLVATSKLRKCRRELIANKEYADIAKENILALASMIEDEGDFPYFKGNDSDNKLYIVITSDSGLCAGYNNNIVAYLERLTFDEKDKSKIIAVGSKGLSYIKRRGLYTSAEYVDIPDIPTIKEIKLIYNNALRLFKDKQVSEVNIVYTDFISPMKQDVKVEKLLPVEKVKGEVGNRIIEPDFDTVLKSSLDIYLKGKLRSVMLSAKCSEQSSRMTAMDGATKNADDILASLKLKYNRIRQTIITQEISEIVGGAEAQK